MLISTKNRQTGEKLDLRKYLIIISLVIVSIQIQAQNGWTNKGLIPTPRAAMTASVIDNKIYVIGGNNGSPNNSDLAVVEVYDPATNTWDTTKAPLPAPRGWLSSAVVNGIIYVIGGGYPTASDSLFAYNPTTNLWSRKANLLSPRRAAQAGEVNGIIYNIGGNQSERNCEAYNPDSNKWTPKTSMPGGGGDVAVTVYNGLIYTFGGSGSGWQPYSNVYAYNPLTDTFITKQNMPTARYGLLTYLVGNKIYAIGGSQGQYTSLAKVEVYDPDLDTWETRADMPFIDYYFAGAVVNNKIYVIGGTPNGQTGMLNVLEYDPALDPTPVEPASFTAIVNYKLEQNYPNPFNPNTKISWQSPVGSQQTLKVFDVLGNEIATLIDEYKPAGRYEVEFQSSVGSRQLASGVYFYQLCAGEYISVKKMILIR